MAQQNPSSCIYLLAIPLDADGGSPNRTLTKLREGKCFIYDCVLTVNEAQTRGKEVMKAAERDGFRVSHLNWPSHKPEWGRAMEPLILEYWAWRDSLFMEETEALV